MEAFSALNLSAEKRDYILNKLNPLLEHMVAETIAAMPGEPVPFLLDWLESKKIEREESGLSDLQREELKAENEVLAAKMQQVNKQLGEVIGVAAKVHEEGSTHAAQAAAGDINPFDTFGEDSGDDLDAPPLGFEDGPRNLSRKSVSAEVDMREKKKYFVPAFARKTPEQKERLKACLTKSFMFAALDTDDIEIIIGSMNELGAAAGERIITVGEAGDFLFVVESGSLNCFVRQDDGKDKVLKTCKTGDVFGELALLYNCARAASVEATEACVLWKLDRETFNMIVKDAAQRKRSRHEAFLCKVPVLDSLDAYERSQLADALHSETFAKGSNIVVQGDPGDKFYIVEDGTAVATKGGTNEVVMTYYAGDYFGELALIYNQPRAATVKCETDCKCVSLNSGSFKRLLNVADLLERSNKYSS